MVTGPLTPSAPRAGNHEVRSPLPSSTGERVAGRASDSDSIQTGEGAGLAALRTRIEQIDRDLVDLIAERTEVAREVGELKRELGLPVLDPAREAAVVRRAGTLARAAGLPDEDVRYLFWHLVGLCRRAQLEGE
jgi:chorismate mutase